MNADVNLTTDADHIQTSFIEVCVCGRSFCTPGAMKKHLRACTKSKKRLSGALDKAKDLWRTRKRRRLAGDGPGPELGQLGPEMLGVGPKILQQGSSGLGLEQTLDPRAFHETVGYTQSPEWQYDDTIQHNCMQESSTIELTSPQPTHEAVLVVSFPKSVSLPSFLF
jgi:hypothetical protein